MDFMFLDGNDVKSLRRVFMAPFPFDSEVEDALRIFRASFFCLSGLKVLPIIFRQSSVVS